MQVVGEIFYKKLKEIGIGKGMNSRVYLANDPQLGGEVAVKEIEKTRFANPTAYFDEARAMFSTAHENVVAVQYACQTSAMISLAMPYYRKGSVAELIEDRPLQLSQVLSVTQGVLAGLAAIHLSKFIHFDVKPSNVLFSKSGKPLVADFGQSRAISASGVVTVPPLYLVSQPPETISTGVATHLADVYHVGMLMYRMLNGDQFFTSQVPATEALRQAQIASGKFPARNRFMPHVPPRMRTLVRKALRVDPIERFQSATEMADSLSRVNLVLDWSIEPLLLDGFRWRALRDGQCDFVVELIDQGGTYDVTAWTERAGEPRRAKDKKANWRSGFSLDDAHLHLKDVFERLQE